MNIHTRIKQRREELGMARKTLADLCGVSLSSVQLWEAQNGTAPSRDRIKIVAEQLKTTAEYLTLGIDANLQSNGKYAFIPRFMEALEGTGSVHFHQEIGDLDDANDTFAYRNDYLAQIGVKAADCRVALQRDDSMALGSQLLVDTTQKALVSGKIYALATRNGVLVRRLFLLTDGSVELRADNPAMRPETVAAGKMPPILGRVVAFQGTLA